MCVIAIQPAGQYLTKEEAKKMWTTNPDGGGYAFIGPDNKIEIVKSMQFQNFWRSFERDRSDNRDKDFLIHMRIATHGSVCIDNVHPFEVNDKTVMAHNGIIHGVPDKDPTGQDRSDTRMFIDLVIPELPELWLDNEYLFDMVQEWVGWSKIVFLTTDERLAYSIYVLNQRKGEWNDGLWYSNRNHAKWQPTKFEEKQKQKSLPKHTVTEGGGDGYVHVNGVYMSMAAYEDWWADSEYNQLSGEDEKEIKELSIADIEELRITQHAMSWELEVEGNELMCTGCFSFVKEENEYQCECYASACESCFHLAEFCGCDVTWRRLTYRQDFSKEDQEAINRIAAIDTDDVHSLAQFE